MDRARKVHRLHVNRYGRRRIKHVGQEAVYEEGTVSGMGHPLPQGKGAFPLVIVVQ